MGSYGIGLSGLRVAQRMIEVVSTNITNVTTEGYHRQEAIASPMILNTYGNVDVGGVEITSVRRSINNLLELEIARHQGNFSQASEELDVLKTVEAAFGEVGSDGLAVAIDRFFNSLTELAADPRNDAMRVQTVWAGDALAGEFRNLGQFLADMESQLQKQAEGYVVEINTLGTEISDLTAEMATLTFHGGSANIPRDRRDQAVKELGELANIKVDGLIDESAESLRVSAWGIPVVSKTSVMELEVILSSDRNLELGAKDSWVYQADARGGKLGAMLSMKNDVISGIRSDLDTLAGQVISAINDMHVQGVGGNGSFSELAGVPVSDQAFSEWDSPITDGSFYVRVTNTNTGAVTRSKIDVTTTDTLADISALVHAVNGVSTLLVDSSLKITADSGYEFDFIPAVLSDPYTSTIAGASTPTMSGIYSGDTNQIYTCTVVGTGDVGVSTSLVLQVRDGDDQLVKSLNIGQGYAAGDLLDIGAGMAVSLTSGGLVTADEFTIQALADSDTSGFLSAVGLNSFFSGTSASNMAVRTDIMDDPARRFACSAGAAMTDSFNIERMIAVGEDSLTALGNTSISDYYRNIVTGVGQAVVVREARVAGLGNVMTQLNSQRDRISGVDINEETAKLMSLERMYQGVARVISAQDKVMATLLELLR